MQLKNYQVEALSVLEDFVKRIQGRTFQEAYADTKKAHNQANPIYCDYPDLSVPNVCFRIPTGGGKTFLGVQAIPILTQKYLNNVGLVFWLAPSTAIVNQTLKALKDPSHAYRKFLEQKFEDRTINVMNIQEALTKPFDLSTELPIIIATIQMFSVEDDDNRKFFEQNGAYEEFFENSEETPSLANAIKACNPIVIMDEAHNAKTNLRVSSLSDLKPSFVLELTATPRKEHIPASGKYASNVIYSVSASQLKAEKMIKLPIKLETVDKWQITIKDALDKRQELEEICKFEEAETGDYIRPIILFKAESKRGSNPITFETILKELQETYGIPREEIAIHTGEYRELDDIDLLSKKCRIRYVISVDALKEGWDAPFAYVLASVADMNSATAVEQLLGRVLRLPYAKERVNKELENAYAFVASSKTTEVINSLKDSLVNNGFEQLEADLHISYTDNSNKEADSKLPGLFEEKETDIQEIDMEVIPEEVKEYINYNKKSKKFSIVKPIPQTKRKKVEEAIVKAVKSEEDKVRVRELVEDIPTMTNYKSSFSLPKLLIKQDSSLFEFDKDVLLEEILWTDQEILKHAKLSKSEFNVSFKREYAELDISEGEKIQFKYLNEIKQNLFSLSGTTLKLNENDITMLVMRHLNLPTIGSRQLQKFVYSVVIDLVREREIDIVELKTNIYQLIEAISNKIKKLEKELVLDKYNSLLSDPSLFEVNAAKVFTFDPYNYPSSNIDERSATFNKHYYKLVDLLNGEEYAFAKWIDGLEEVEFWVRNIDRNPQHSFWLQTSTDKFYPDFIVKLKSGKILVIEYKGSQYKGSEDTVEKEKVGQLWASLSNDYDFALVFENDFQDKVEQMIKA
jgi:type III restriction enzyme